MSVNIRASLTWTTTDLLNLLRALETANCQYKPAFDSLRVALGEPTVTDVTIYERQRKNCAEQQEAQRWQR